MKKLLLLNIIWFSITLNAQFGSQQIISSVAANATSVYAADLDGDNDIDVLSASIGDEKVAWYENIDGQGNFIEHLISETIIGARDVYAADLDGDNDIDVLAASRDVNKIVWFENTDGLGTFSAQIVITNIAEGARAIFAADLDGDNDIDVISASHLDNKIAWYENTDGLGNFGSQQIISNSALSARDVYAIDLDGDNDNDVLAAAQGTAEVIWFENLDGLANFGKAQVISNSAIGVESIFAADLDGDDDLDVLAGEGIDDTVTWFENLDGLGTFGSEQVINSNVDTIREVFAVDIDNDDDVDVLTASQGDGKIAWYENTNGLGSFGPQQIITTETDGAYSVFAADLDGDNDMDVLSASIVDSKIAWYENLTLIGIDDFYINSIYLQPNPVSTLLNINNIDNIQIESIKIYDTLGKLLLQEKEQFNSINVSHLNSGLLFVKVETEHGDITKKLIKQ